MIDIDATIHKAPPEYKNALKAEKEAYTRIHKSTKAVLNGGFTEASHVVNLKVEICVSYTHNYLIFQYINIFVCVLCLFAAISILMVS